MPSTEEFTKMRKMVSQLLLEISEEFEAFNAKPTKEESEALKARIAGLLAGVKHTQAERDKGVTPDEIVWPSEEKLLADLEILGETMQLVGGETPIVEAFTKLFMRVMDNTIDKILAKATVKPEEPAPSA